MQETQTYIKLKNKPKNNYPEYIICHHSGGTDANPLLDTSHHTAQMMETWHLSKGWQGLGYQYVIHKNGEIWRGRPEDYEGAHTFGYNTKSIGICLSGNFDATLPTKEQENALVGLLGAIRGRFMIPLDKIAPHRTFVNKTCYGKLLKDDWARNLIATPNVVRAKQLLEEALKLL